MVEFKKLVYQSKFTKCAEGMSFVNSPNTLFCTSFWYSPMPGQAPAVSHLMRFQSQGMANLNPYWVRLKVNHSGVGFTCLVKLGIIPFELTACYIRRFSYEKQI